MFTLFADGDLWTNFKWGMLVFFAIVGLIGWAIGQAGRNKVGSAGLKYGGSILWHFLSKR